MQQLVLSNSTEVAWHGTVVYDKTTLTIVVEDIFVYPQDVSGATVDSIDEEYGPWLMALPDATFKKLKMQGHSHANMGAFASTTDRQYYDTVMLPQIKDHYLFIIINKRGDMYAEFYDVANNILYENADIEHEILLSNDQPVLKWIDDTKKIIVSKHKVKSPVVIDETIYDEDEYGKDETEYYHKKWRDMYGHTKTY